MEKSLWKFFIIFFIIIFTIINWNKILLFFNYKMIEHNISNVLVGKSEQNDIKVITKNLLNIPKINVSAPIVSQKTNSVKEAKQLLKNGVLLYFDSARPGEKGRTIILGHSAPPGWPDVDYENIFSNLYKLTTNDRIIIDYNGKEYIYYVFDKKIFFPKDENSTLVVNKKDSTLILITCWPQGKDYKRLAIFARLLH